MSVKHRSLLPVSLSHFYNWNYPDNCGKIFLDIPNKTPNILRMLIRDLHEELLVPDELNWVMPLINRAIEAQKDICEHPFLYLTIRNEEKNTNDLKEWHVDGFSTRITHLPEQNYIWCNNNPTEYFVRPINFPTDFDPLKHNVNKYLEKFVNEVITINTNTLYRFDPYIPHRQPEYTGKRVFIRISFTPIEIKDCNNTRNPLNPKKYYYDGVKDFRNKLITYKD